MERIFRRITTGETDITGATRLKQVFLRLPPPPGLNFAT